MAINKENVIDRVMAKLPSIGIDTEIDGKESHTVKMIRSIVSEILNEIIIQGEVIISNVPVKTQGNASYHEGVANGKARIR